MARTLTLIYGLVGYVAFFAVFGASVGFVANVEAVRGIDRGASAPLPVALAIDLGLIALFGVSHSVMARPAFKERWVRVVPQAAERSTYVLVASLALALLVWQWRAIPFPVWNVEHPSLRSMLWGVSGGGILLLVWATFLTDHFDLFGLRQVWLFARGQPYSPVPFKERSLYKYVRHPMMIGVIVWFWATPAMSVGHLVFAVAMSVYVLVGVTLEERDLTRKFGDAYRSYRERVTAFLPVGRR